MYIEYCTYMCIFHILYINRILYSIHVYISCRLANRLEQNEQDCSRGIETFISKLCAQDEVKYIIY